MRSHTPIRHKDTGVRDSRRGYCECCLTKYADLEKVGMSEYISLNYWMNISISNINYFPDMLVLKYHSDQFVVPTLLFLF